ncbi:MAG: NIL domain-containing protein [Bacillota bacterium]
MKRVKALLTFMPSDIGKPITYHLVKDYDLWVNILHAEISASKTGNLVLDLEGEDANMERAVAFLAEQAVTFRLLNGSVTVSKDNCVHCGACTSVCPSGALRIEGPHWVLDFQKDKCYVCQLCVKACPLRAISVNI